MLINKIIRYFTDCYADRQWTDKVRRLGCPHPTAIGRKLRFPAPPPEHVIRLTLRSFPFRPFPVTCRFVSRQHLCQTCRNWEATQMCATLQRSSNGRTRRAYRAEGAKRDVS